MRRASLFAAYVLAVPIAIASCSSDDSSGPSPTCGGGTGVPCIDGSLPDSLAFTYDAPTQYADVALPDVALRDSPVADAAEEAGDAAELSKDAGDAADSSDASDSSDAQGATDAEDSADGA
jgi:hypothetical protein